MILVDKKPTKPEECLFCIHSGNKYTAHACQFRMRRNSDWDEGISFRGGENGNGCWLCFDKPCPFLITHMYY